MLSLSYKLSLSRNLLTVHLFRFIRNSLFESRNFVNRCWIDRTIKCIRINGGNRRRSMEGTLYYVDRFLFNLRAIQWHSTKKLFDKPQGSLKVVHDFSVLNSCNRCNTILIFGYVVYARVNVLLLIISRTRIIITDYNIIKSGRNYLCKI